MGNGGAERRGPFTPSAFAAFIALGALAVAGDASATVIRDEALSYSYSLDDEFQPMEGNAPPRFHHVYIKGAGTPEVIVVGVMHLGGVISDDPPSKASLPLHTTCGPGHWQTHKVHVCESRPPNGAFVLQAELPLAPEAVIVNVSGRAEQEAVVRETMQSVLASFAGRWAPARGKLLSPEEMGTRVGQALGSAFLWIAIGTALLRRRFGWGGAMGLATLGWVGVASGGYALLRSMSRPPVSVERTGSPAGAVPSFAPASVASAEPAPIALSEGEQKALAALDAKVADAKKSLSAITSAKSPKALEVALADIDAQCAKLGDEVTKLKAHLTPRGTKTAGDVDDLCRYQRAIAALKTSTSLLPKHPASKKTLCLGATKALKTLHDVGRDNDADVAGEVEKLGKLCM